MQSPHRARLALVVSFLTAGAALALSAPSCNSSGGGGAGTGGAVGSGGDGQSTGSGGSDNSGGSTGSGGSDNSGGSTGSGGAVATGGKTGTGGETASGGISGTGGKTATGGAGGHATGGSGTGGSVGSGGGSGGTPATGGAGGTGTGAAYQGPCDVLSGGCAEAYSVTRAMRVAYTGPLFQLTKVSDKTTKDIGQTADHAVDLSTWSAFCGGTAAGCVVSKIYAQVHSGSNDLLPAVWKAPWGPDCSAGGLTCAARFTMESATGMPILTTTSPQEYALSGDNYATGINGGTKAMGIMYNGKPVANSVYCCGVIGLTHKYNANDTAGTDFMLALAYGWRDSGGCCIAVNCGSASTYCVGAEEEENNDLADYGSSPVANALVVTQYDPTTNAVSTYLNGVQKFSHTPPKAKLNASTAVHLGGGGDLSQPDAVLMREAFFTNAVMSSSDVAALKANAIAFYPMLSFP
jgi:Alpha-L-arabinofuranosidase B, catalytic